MKNVQEESKMAKKTAAASASKKDLKLANEPKPAEAITPTAQQAMLQKEESESMNDMFDYQQDMDSDNEVKLNRLNTVSCYNESTLDKNRKKHNRRTSNMIAKQYTCPYRNCGKFYGSDGSLNLHIKIKHNGGSKTDREKLAKTIIVAFMKGHLSEVIDKIDLNLPPGTISKAARKYGLNDQVENQVL